MSDLTRADLGERLREAWRLGYYAACDYHRIDDDTTYPSEIDTSLENAGVGISREDLEQALRAEGAEEVEVTRGATQYLWRCRSCGGDHGEESCENPDLYDYTLWRMFPEPDEPGTYLLLKVEDR